MNFPDMYILILIVLVRNILILIPRYVMSILDGGFNTGRDMLYFTAPEAYLNDKRGAYGQNMSFALSQFIPELPVNTTADPLDVRSGDVILVGKWTTFTLVAPLNKTLSQTKTPFLVSCIIT